jgi:hypothetical protein
MTDLVLVNSINEGVDGPGPPMPVRESINGFRVFATVPRRIAVGKHPVS